MIEFESKNSVDVDIYTSSQCGLDSEETICNRESDACYTCNPTDYDIINTLRSDKYWASALQDTDDDLTPLDIVLGLRQNYQLSGFMIDLGDALIPQRVDIFKIKSSRITKVRTVHFDQGCNHSRNKKCQNELGVSGSIYVNLVSREWSSENVTASEVIFRLYGSVNDADLKKSERYYKIHRLKVYGRCICNGQADECTTSTDDHIPECRNCRNGRTGANCDQCPNIELASHLSGPCPSCECNGHSKKCVWENSKVKCTDCQHGTSGDQCQQCPANQYHRYGNVREACESCNCHTEGSLSSQCSSSGRCECRLGFRGDNCATVDEDIMLWNELENDKIESLSTQETACFESSYSCLSGETFTSPCGNLTILPGDDHSSNNTCSLQIQASNLLVVTIDGNIEIESNGETNQLISGIHSICSDNVRVNWRQTSATQLLTWHVTQSDFNCQQMNLSETIAANVDYLQRSARLDQPDQLFTRNFLSRLRDMNAEFNYELGPARDALEFINVAMKQELHKFDHKDLFYIQTQIETVANKLGRRLDDTEQMLSQLMHEVTNVKFSEGSDDEFGSLEQLEEGFVAIRDLYDDLQRNWNDIFDDAKRENKWSHQLFHAVLDKFGKPTEFGHCWQFDEDNIQTLHRLQTPEESEFTFDPFPLENVASWYDVSERDQNHFGDLTWYDSNPDWEPESQDTTVDTRNEKPQKKPQTGVIEFDYNCYHYEYRLDEQSRGYSGALGKCEQRGQELLRIQDTEELDHVIGRIKSYKNADLGQTLTGLRVLPRTTGWAWELKAARNRLKWYEGWSPNEPKPDVTARCASMTAKGWSALPCDRKLPYYVCLGRVSNDSKAKKKHEYRFFIRSGAFDYEGAVNGCQEVGFQLALIPSSRENEQLKELFDENPHMTSAWIGLRTFSDDIEFDWEYSNQEALNFELMNETIQIKAEEKVLEIGKPACLALQHTVESLTWELVDCQTQNTGFICFAEVCQRRKRREVEPCLNKTGEYDDDGTFAIPTLRRVFTRRDPVLDSFSFNLPDGYDFLFAENEEVPIEVLSHLDYDWHWPRYGVLADQKRCVDVVYETYRNLSTSIGKIDGLSTKVQVTVATQSELNDLTMMEVRENEIVVESMALFDAIADNLILAAGHIVELKSKKTFLDDKWQLLRLLTPQSLRNMLDNHKQRFSSLWDCDHEMIQRFMSMYPELETLDYNRNGICQFFTDIVRETMTYSGEITSLVDKYLSQLPYLTRVNITHCEDIDPRPNMPITNEGVELFCFVGDEADLAMVAESELEDAQPVLDALCHYLRCLFDQEDEDTECGDIPVWSELSELLYAARNNPKVIINDPELTELVNEFEQLVDQMGALYFALRSNSTLDDADGLVAIMDEFDEKANEIAATYELLVHYDQYYAGVNDLQSLDEFAVEKFDLINENLNKHEEHVSDLPHLLAQMEEAVDSERLGSLGDSMNRQSNAIDDVEAELAALESILASSRSLLDRFDQAKNSMKLTKEHGVSLYNKPDFDNYHAIHFEVEFELRLGDAIDNNVVYIGDGATFIDIGTVNGQVVVDFGHSGAKKTYTIIDQIQLESNTWYNVKITDTGSKMWLDVDCLGVVRNGKLDEENCDTMFNERGDNADVAYDTRGFEPNPNMIKINGEARKWRINQDHIKMIIGDRKHFGMNIDENDFNGFDGTIKSPSFNGFALSLWNIDETSLEETSSVPDDMEHFQSECYSVRDGEVKTNHLFGKTNKDRDTCICLSGDQSYAKISATDTTEHESPIRLFFHQKLEIHTKYTPTQENKHALVALMFNEENGGFVLMEQNEGMMILKMRPSFNHEIEIIEGESF